MKRVKQKLAKVLALFLAVVMCSSVALPMYAQASGTLTTPVEGKEIYSTDFEATDVLSTFNPYKNGGSITQVADSDTAHGNVIELKRTGTGEFRLGTDKSGAPLTMTSTSSSIVYEVDVKIANTAATNFNAYIRKPVNGSNKMSYLFRVEAGKLKARSGNLGVANFTELATLSANTWYKIAVVQNYATGYRDVYLDGVKVSTDNTLTLESEYADGGIDVNVMRIECAGISGTLSETNTDNFFIDNLKVYEGTQPLAESALTAPVEGKSIYSTDFEASDVLTTFNPYKNGGSIGQVADSDTAHGNVIEFKRTGTGEFRLGTDKSGAPLTITSTSSSIVYEMDVKIGNLAATNFNTWIRKPVNGSNKYSYLFRVEAGKLKARNGNSGVANFTELATLSKDTWYKISVVQNYATGYRDVYLDGVKVSTDNTLALENEFADGGIDVNVMRIECAGISGTLSEANTDNFFVDNFKIYEGTKPLVVDDGRSLKAPVEGKSIYSTDFEAADVLTTFNPYKNGGSIAQVADSDTTHGNVIEFKRTGAGEFRLGTDKSGAPLTVTSRSNSIVYEMDVKLGNYLAATNFNAYIRKPVNGSNKMSILFRVEAGKLKARNGNAATANFTELASLSANTWYKISVVQNYATGYRDIYLNGIKVSTDNTLALESEYADGAVDVKLMRIECAGISGSLSEANTDNFFIDNLKIYEGTKPLVVKQPIVELYSTDFEAADVLTTFNPYKNGGSISQVADSDTDYGKVIEFKRTGTGEFRLGTDKSGAPLTVSSDADSIVYEMDVKIANLAATNFNAYIRKPVNGSNKMSIMFRIEAGKLKARNGNVATTGFTELASLNEDAWYRIAVVQNYETGYRDVYLNGVKVSTDNTLALESEYADGAAAVNLMRIECAGISGTLSASNTDNFFIDNLAIYESTEPKPYDAGAGDVGDGGEGGDEDDDDDTVTLRDPVEGTKIFAADFNAYNALTTKTAGGSINRVDDADTTRGKVLEIQRTQSGTLALESRGTPSAFSTDSNSVVYEFDLNLQDVDATAFSFYLRKMVGGSNKYSYVCYVSNGELKVRNGSAAIAGFTTVKTLEEDTWYTIAVVQNYKTGFRDVYVNGTKVSTDNTLAIEAEFLNGTTDLNLASIECNSTTDHFKVDNVRIYEGTAPYTGELLEKQEEDVVIVIDPNKSLFEDDKLLDLWSSEYLDTLLNGYVALHTRSGQVYKAGEKTVLATAPVETANGFDVVLSEICDALGLTYSVSGSSATVNGQTVAVSEKDGKAWVDAEELLATYGVVSVDTNETIKSGGMMIAGASAFTWPSDENKIGQDLKTLGTRSMLQNLNEYLFLEQPSAADITALYNASAAKNQHPRVQATKEDFDRIKSEIQTNDYVNNWYQQIIAAADYLVDVNTTPLKYEFRDGVRLLQVSRDMLDHMYTLGMAYQLTGEQKYADRAWIDLEAVAKFPDWHPQHGLDTVEMTAAVAIGYDWMYDGLNESQRTVVEKGMYKHSFALACASYQSTNSSFWAAVLQDGNQNVVVNAGFAMGALAMMDKYPAESALIVSGALKAVEAMMIEFGPDGAWKEGTNYWEYTMQYGAKMLSSLESVFGTSFGLDKCEGLSTAGNYIMHMQSDKGLFNYGDASASHYYVPEIFYLADKYDNKDLMATVLDVNHGEMLNCEDVVLSLLWYNDGLTAGAGELPTDGVYWTEGVAAFRDIWTDGATAYVGVHGGKTNVMHAQLDGGSFVYDYAGVRWAKELDRTPYDTSVSSDRSESSGRWLLYKSKAEAHNTLVINPDGAAEQKIGSTAKMLRFESDNRGGIAVLDLTENYADDVTSAIRGYFFTDDRTSLVVRDEITLSQANSTVYWFMQTDADVVIAADGKSATLTQDGKQVTLEFVTTGNGTAELSYGPSTRALLGTTSPLAGTSEASKDTENPEVNRIAIKLSGASGDVTITTKLTPANVNSTPVSDYDKSISTWAIPQGEIAAKPEVQKVVIDGREIVFNGANSATFLCVEGKYATVPAAVVTVDETKFTYEVTNAATTDGGATTILVKDKTNPNVMTSYTVVFEEIPVAAVPAGFTGNALQVVDVTASDEPQADLGYVAWKVLDQDTDSRWTSQGIGNWILLELEKEATVDDLIILFKNGHVRYTYFNVSVSTDGENFEMVYSGESAGPAIGNAEAYEQFDLGGKTAKYIKIGCNGNSAQGIVAGWNNIGEVVFTGTVTNTGTGSAGSGVPAPTPDDDQSSDDTSQAPSQAQSGKSPLTGESSLSVFWGMAVVAVFTGAVVCGMISRKKFR